MASCALKIEDQKRIYGQKIETNKKIIIIKNCLSITEKGGGTHSGAVVDFLPHIVADVLQLQL